MTVVMHILVCTTVPPDPWTKDIFPRLGKHFGLTVTKLEFFLVEQALFIRLANHFADVCPKASASS
jgi:hypothetical protein